MLTIDRLRFNYNTLENNNNKNWVKTYVGDARKLDKIADQSIDFIATHPPYANIIGYTKNSGEKDLNDLSKVRNVEEFVNEMRKVAKEFYRVLKPGKYCAILIGDTRRNKHHVPISFRVMQSFLDVGFILKENIIKLQHNMKTTPLWRTSSVKYNFLLLAHEHLFVFRKLGEKETLSKFKESIKWW
jgi:DNA modification methylase